jgi:hypothetical protein
MKTFQKTKKKLERLSRKYIDTIVKVVDTTERNKIKTYYYEKLERLLYDTIGNNLDSMKLIVDTIIEKNLNVTTNFYSEGLKFSFTMQYLDKMNPAQTEEYNYVRNLKKGDSINTNFIFLGGFRIENPQNVNDKGFKIFAYPNVPNSITKYKDTLNSIEKKKLVDSLEKAGATGI